MSAYPIRGVSVNFPFPPYDVQTAYMEKVIECLEDKKNGLLVRPEPNLLNFAQFLFTFFTPGKSHGHWKDPQSIVFIPRMVDHSEGQIWRVCC